MRVDQCGIFWAYRGNDVVTLVSEMGTVILTHKFLNKKSFSQGVATYPVFGVRSLALPKPRLLQECQGLGWEKEGERLMSSTCVSVVHQRLLEKAELGLTEAVTAKLSGLLPAKVSFSLSVPFDPMVP